MANGEIPQPISGGESQEPAVPPDLLLGPNETVMDAIHRRSGSRPATEAEVAQFEELYGPLSTDGEG